MMIQKISFSGTPKEIGLQHGEMLAEQIRHNIEFYKSLFLDKMGDPTRILEAAAQFQEAIRAYSPEMALEIDHMAIGAGISEPLWLYALNARTELSMLNGKNECTAIVCPRKNLLAQTWDWAEKLEGNFFIMELSFPDGHKILQLSEAGMVGKIGLNNKGIGVTLNYLYDGYVNFSTIPIHILLRCILECRTVKEARDSALKSGVGKASNVIVAGAGSAVDIEFAGDLLETFEITTEAYVHTNHFLHAKTPNIVDDDSYLNSLTRHKTASQLIGNTPVIDAQKLGEVLSDQTNGRNSILAGYKPDPEGMLGEYGTLATVVMELERVRLLVRGGNPKNRDFSIDVFEEYVF